MLMKTAYCQKPWHTIVNFKMLGSKKPYNATMLKEYSQNVNKDIRNNSKCLI